MLSQQLLVLVILFMVFCFCDVVSTVSWLLTSNEFFIYAPSKYKIADEMLHESKIYSKKLWKVTKSCCVFDVTEDVVYILGMLQCNQNNVS